MLLDHNNFIFDFDGVIVDSNLVKKKAIFQASKSFAKDKYIHKFVTYFTKNSGIPREKKIKKFFKKNDYLQIKENYEMILEKS